MILDHSINYLNISKENPYTREKFPDNFIKSAEEITIQLKSKNKVLSYDSQINAERKIILNK